VLDETDRMSYLSNLNKLVNSAPELETKNEALMLFLYIMNSSKSDLIARKTIEKNIQYFPTTLACSKVLSQLQEKVKKFQDHKNETNALYKYLALRKQEHWFGKLDPKEKYANLKRELHETITVTKIWSDADKAALLIHLNKD